MLVTQLFIATLVLSSAVLAIPALLSPNASIPLSREQPLSNGYAYTEMLSESRVSHLQRREPGKWTLTGFIADDQCRNGDRYEWNQDNDARPERCHSYRDPSTNAQLPMLSILPEMDGLDELANGQPWFFVLRVWFTSPNCDGRDAFVEIDMLDDGCRNVLGGSYQSWKVVTKWVNSRPGVPYKGPLEYKVASESGF